MDKLSVITLQGLGNSILAIPVLRSLSSSYSVTACIMANGAESLYRQFYPEIHVRSFVNTWDLLVGRIEDSDTAISLYPNWKRELTVLLRCHARRKLSFVDSTYWVTSFVRWQTVSREIIHDIDNNFAMVSLLGGSERFPELMENPIREDNKRISIHPTASTPLKYYSVQFWAALITWFQKEGWRIDLFTGRNADEQTRCAAIINMMREKAGIRIHAGEKLNDVASTIMRSQLFIGSDSSLMHLAALLDVKTVGLWSFSDFRRIFPYGRHACIYLPRETLDAVSFDLPRVRPRYLERASVEDVIEIAHSARKPDMKLETRFRGDVGAYLF